MEFILDWTQDERVMKLKCGGVFTPVCAEHQEISLGHSVHLKCELSDGNEEFQVLWMKKET